VIGGALDPVIDECSQHRTLAAIIGAMLKDHAWKAAWNNHACAAIGAVCSTAGMSGYSQRAKLNGTKSARLSLQECALAEGSQETTVGADCERWNMIAQKRTARRALLRDFCLGRR